MSLELKDYKVLSVLGTGSYGTCYKVVKCKTNEVFAWKAIDYGQIPDDKKQLIVSEVNLLSQLCHPNIVQYYGRILNKETTTLYILMECCDGGDLATLIKKCKNEDSLLSEGFVWRVLYQTGRALQACHSHLSNKTVLHRDIKPANVFLDVEGNVKLGDFGLARILDSGGSLAQSVVGTPYYMSPEIIKEEKYNHKSDVWSLGCLVYEMCCLVPPFRAGDQRKLVARIKLGKFERIPSRYSADLQDIISQLLTLEPAVRPSVEAMLHHPTVVTNLVGGSLESFTIVGSDKLTGDFTRGSQAMRQREASLRERELAVEERERRLERREREVSLLDRIAREKMCRADVYLRQCKQARSSKSTNLSNRSATLSNLDSSFSGDAGDGDEQTCARLVPNDVAKPRLFSRRVSFGSLPGIQEENSYRPVVEKYGKPLVENSHRPLVGNFSKPLVENSHMPLVENYSKPLVENSCKPLVENSHMPLVDNYRKPLVEKHRKPLVDNYSKPLVENSHRPLVEKHRKPLVEKHRKPLGPIEENSCNDQLEGYDRDRSAWLENKRRAYNSAPPHKENRGPPKQKSLSVKSGTSLAHFR